MRQKSYSGLKIFFTATRPGMSRLFIVLTFLFTGQLIGFFVVATISYPCYKSAPKPAFAEC
jgi:hypothetical protein